mmetsp:Transcript_21290/g.57317  ORF Transcript_21290/g.57317 Transcript_21290/m.57317 type:complete len:207 (+) Transcript_21290:118-738(+)
MIRHGRACPCATVRTADAVSVIARRTCTRFSSRLAPLVRVACHAKPLVLHKSLYPDPRTAHLCDGGLLGLGRGQRWLLPRLDFRQERLCRRVRVKAISLHVLAQLLHNVRQVAVEVRDRAHLHLGAVLERQDNVARGAAKPAEPLDVDDLLPRRLNDLLALESRCDLNTPAGELVPRPSLTRDRRREWDDTNDRQNGDARDDHLRR